MSHLIKLTQFSGIASLLEISRSLEKGRLFGLISDVTELLVCPSDVKIMVLRRPFNVDTDRGRVM